MAIYTVNTLADENNGIGVGGVSLREAINAANANPGQDTIRFDSTVFNGSTAYTFTLTRGELVLSDSAATTIDGNSVAAPIIINNSSDGTRVFRIASGANAVLNDVTITGGSSNADGGGILNNGTLAITNSTITNNQASFSSGGIHNNGNLTITNSTISNNSANFDGGGISNNGNLTITRSTISNNSSSYGGGLISNTSANFTTTQTRIINSTISGNTASAKGGGLYNNSGQTTILNSTITNNQAVNNGGSGIASTGNAVTRTVLGNTIVAGNVNTDVDLDTDFVIGGVVQSIISNGFNLVGRGGAASAFTGAGDQSGVTNPGLGALANNGGLTQTHALLPNSPAVNAGSNALIPAGAITDQRGSTRISGGTVDIGAVERQPGILTFTSATYSAIEGNNGPVNAIIAVVQRQGGSEGAVTVQVAIANGTATAGEDYTAISPITVSFAPGETSKQVIIPIVGDTGFEPNETIGLTLGNPTGGATLGGQSTSTFTIVNDDPEPVPGTLAFTSATYSAPEGNSDTPNTVIATIARSGGSDGTVTVVVTRAGGTATPGSDFTDGFPITVTFAPGETQKQIEIPIVGDTVFEPDETLELVLSNPTGGATLGNQSTTTFTIVNDDVAPIPGTISFTTDSGSVLEGNSGTASVVVATLQRTGGSDGVVSVEVVLAAGGSATPDSDFLNSLPLTVTFADGETTKQIELVIVGDTIVEADETLQLVLQNPTTGATLGTQTTTTFTIVNDDVALIPNVAIAPKAVSQPEGNSSTAPYSFDVSLSAPSTEPVVVSFTTVDGTATAANGDYVPISGTLTFAPGEVLKEITVLINGDTIIEPDEAFTIDLTVVSGAVLGTGTATGLILNDDAEIVLPTVTLTPATISVLEGNSGVTELTFTVALSGSATQPVVVSFVTEDGTATATDNDFAPGSGTLTFLPGGANSQIITVAVTGDTTVEPNETFGLRLTGATNAVLGNANATITILNDDEAGEVLSGLGGQKQFTIAAGSGTTTIRDFGGVGRGTQLSTAQIAEVDTLRLVGDGLTARNLLLAQVGNNLQITFDGVANTTIVLENMQLDLIDNLLQRTGANVNIGNILFSNETTIQDSFDVLDNFSNPAAIFNRNSTTFLNGLNNSIRGFDQSNDVINGLDGNDLLEGLSGDDVLRGGSGNDTLLGGDGNDFLRGGIGNDSINGGNGNDIIIGGVDNDVLTGGAGADSFTFNTGNPFSTAGLGVDTITDFVVGLDKVALSKTTFAALVTMPGQTLAGTTDFAIVASEAAAAISEAHILYNSSTGELYYNPNKANAGFGSGGLFAVLSNAPSLTASDIVIQA
ncbi:beta strand repeat-containing protein [Leptolyngbya sp. AN02str]|uniref:beta strand repeat-containing protein n=1 Tax=Leptolyngbya sp. AN02str TaxID=3423363 RepID=UPI003D30F166